jgi:CheY-like chemotaxis protein
MEKKIILIGEDQKDIAEMYKIAFNNAGFDVVSAYDGDEVIDKIKAGKPDILLLDIGMPAKDGFEVLREVSADPVIYGILKNTPIIMLTNYNNPQDIEYCMKMGAQDYLVKTEWTPETIVQKVKKYLAR